jgi:F-type H+-transporting ATPase subunit gamma
MPSLKEIKNRVGSVQNTLKITSAMKLVASSKLRKAQRAIEAMRPYQQALQGILSHLLAVPGVSVSGALCAPGADFAHGADVSDGRCAPEADFAHGGTAVVAFASNSSLCGAFNANAVRKALQVIGEAPGEVTVFSFGRKIAEAMKKTGHPSPQNFSAVSERPSYAPMSALAESLMADFAAGRYSRVVLVYNHFVSTARQEPVAEVLLPAVMPSESSASPDSVPFDAILEPSAQALVEELLPKSIKLRLYSALLDSAAAEHAARTVAMQMATDNGNDLLQELVLQYNKSRQQKITSEILDLAGGQQE